MTDIQPAQQLELTDEVVIAARADDVALGRVFDHFYPEILRYCLRRMLVRAAAEDVTSEVFLKVAGNIRKFQGTHVEDLRRWLFRITTNEVNGYLRKSLRRRTILEAAARMGYVKTEVSRPLLHSDIQISWDEVYDAISTLSQREQSILSLRFFASLRHNQIASILQMSPGSVRVALNRALEKLRDRLRESETPCRTTGVIDGSN